MSVDVAGLGGLELLIIVVMVLVPLIVLGGLIVWLVVWLARR